MKHLFIINPKAGKYDHTGELVPLIERHMKSRGEPYRIALTEYPLHAAKLIQENASDEEDLRVYVCGGDGTLNEAAQGAAGQKNIAVTHYPCGTGNDFIRLFGRDSERFSDLPALIDGEIKEVDLIECNGRFCINICSVGFDARVGGGVARFKRIPFISGYAAYNLSLLYNLFSGLHRPYRVSVDSVPYDGRYTMFVACNGRYYGSGYNPVPEAMPDDGLIDFLLVRPVTLFTVARVIKRYQLGQHRLLPKYITWIRGHRLDFESNSECPVNLDGEIVSARKASFAISDRKLRFIVPKGASWENAAGTAEYQRV